MDNQKKLGPNKISLGAGTNNKYKCEICEKEFKKNDGLKTHINIVHLNLKEPRCYICQKVFKIQSELNLHEKISHENKKYHKCDSCGKAFSSRTFTEAH